jgi:hypothetical protein
MKDNPYKDSWLPLVIIVNIISIISTNRFDAIIYIVIYFIISVNYNISLIYIIVLFNLTHYYI